MRKFTLSDALIIQVYYLAHWKKRLNEDCYTALEQFAIASNEGKTDPYSICRGGELDTFVLNWKPNTVKS